MRTVVSSQVMGNITSVCGEEPPKHIGATSDVARVVILDGFSRSNLIFLPVRVPLG